MSRTLWRSAEPEALLSGVRVVDGADGKGETCARFLADLGADVIRVAPDGGARTSSLRNANKRGVRVDRDRLLALLDTADIWIETGTLGPAPDVALARNPGLVIVSITDFGQTGEYRDWTGGDAVITAMSGILSRSGLAGREPLLPPPGMAYETAAIQAAWAAIVAYWHRLETGCGDHIDFSLLEAAMQTLDPAHGAASVSRASGAPATRGRPEPGLYPIFPCADGHVRLVLLAPRQWRAMRAWLGEPEEFQDERFDAITPRLQAAPRLHRLYAALFAPLTAAAIAAEGQARGVPVAPVLTVPEVLDSPHFAARGTFIDAEVAPGVRARVPSGCLTVDGVRAGFRHRAPEPGEHDADLALPAGARSGSPGGRPRRPLSGLRVVDFGTIVIGNEIGRLLADQGADVIKIEHRAFPDAARVGYGGTMSPSFVAGSRNKRSFGVNLRTPEGVALLERLVAGADVVLENFKPGTLDKLGLGYEALRAVNPDLVMLSTNALGSTGPWSGRPGYGPIVRCLSGVTSLWRYPDDPLGFAEPTTIYPDHYGARLCAAAVLAALVRRRRTGAGARLEVAQAELIINQFADVFAGVPPADAGAVYPCAGDDEWCVIAPADEGQRSALRRVAGERPAEWTRTRPPREVMETLQAAGVPAGMMMRPDDHEQDPHLGARGVHRDVHQPGLGRVRLEDGPFRSRTLPPVRLGPAPQHGEHTREICATLLGLSEPEIEALLARGVLEGPTTTGALAA
jgi:crotonobetainyl-CoA:carnitine CoA-transferase CaiB-like acyl-CoA transferase